MGDAVRRVAVVGGTGLVGRLVVAEVRRRGSEAVAVSRATGTDAVTGAGLPSALAGCGVVVDVANVATTRENAATAFFTAVAEQVERAAPAAGVRHRVVLSIVGCDAVPGFGYYRAKTVQEQHVLASGLTTTVLRATQFHEFAGQLLARGRGPWAVVPRMRVQPVAAAEVARVLADLALDGVPPAAARRAPDLAGPRPEDLARLARAVHARTLGSRRPLVVPLPGRTGRQLAGGALLPGDHAVLAGATFDAWLAAG